MEPLGPALLLVIYDRGGKVRHRQRLSQLPVSIGRSPRCDVVLDDRQVSAVHAVLEQDAQGQLVLRDQQSRNGLRLGHERVKEVVFPAKRAVVVGDTRIGIVALDAPLERTEIRRISVLDRRRILAPALVLVSLLSLFSGWISAEDPKLLKLTADELLPVWILLGLWALVCAVASRIGQGAFRYVGHLTIATVGVCAIRFIYTLASPALSFWGGASAGATRTFTEVTCLAIGAWLVAQHLARISAWSLRRCALIGAALMVLLGVPLELDRLAKQDEFTGDLAIPSTSLPYVPSMRAVSPTEFLSKTEALQRESDQLRLKK